jgi:hypothetical protein
VVLLDALRELHYTCFKKLYSPKSLISDNAPAIRNAFFSVFGNDVKWINCWAHVFRNIANQSKSLKNKEEETNFFNDLHLIQASVNAKQFKVLRNLLVEKWNHHPFLEKIRGYLFNNVSWYEGYSLNDPSTNNCLESMHRR